MRRVSWLLPLLAIVACKESTPRGAVKLTVTYEGFRPDCVLVVARDTASGQELSQEVEGKGERTGGSLVVGVLPPDGWGSSVEVVAHAYERVCAGDPVVTRSERVTVTRGQTTQATLRLLATDGDQDGYVDVLGGGTDCRDDVPTIHPGVTEERCNDVDDNCNGQSDLTELRLGQSCAESPTCEGTRQCGANGQVVCAVPNAVVAYPDRDGDGHGDRSATATSFCNGVPAGFTTNAADDCDDTRAAVRPGAQELCNDLDDNCDGNQNEGFPTPGSACTDPVTQCGGQYACDAVVGSAVCQLTQTPTNWLLDADGDGYGGGAAIASCTSPGTGYVTQGGDCNDGNPFTHPGARELCDQEDNDCDSQAEAAGVCPSGGPIWASQTVGSGSPNWRSVVTPASGEVGVVGHIDARARLAAGGTTFQATSGCYSDVGWNALWIDAANNGRGYFGSYGGLLVFQDGTNPSCSLQHDINLQVTGLVGIRNGADLEIHGVTSTWSVSNEGSTFIWNGGDTVTSGTTRVAPLYDLHGVSRNALFAVGGYEAGWFDPVRPRIYRFNADTGQWQQETLPSNLGAVRIKGIWVVNEKLAFAVGQQSTVLKWDGTSWSKQAFPNSVEELVSVVAFGPSSAYATAYNGRIYRLDGQGWRQVHEDTSARFNDIAGTSPEDLWVVGENGQILHWPQWPQ